MMKPTLEQARKAKALLLSDLKTVLAGVGIIRREGVLGLTVNVAKAADAKTLPSSVGSVPIHQVNIVGKVSALQKNAMTRVN